MAVGNKIIPLWLCFCPAVFQVRHSKTAHPDTSQESENKKHLRNLRILQEFLRHYRFLSFQTEHCPLKPIFPGTK